MREGTAIKKDQVTYARIISWSITNLEHNFLLKIHEFRRD